jgi:zinc transporter ZupT
MKLIVLAGMFVVGFVAGGFVVILTTQRFLSPVSAADSVDLSRHHRNAMTSLGISCPCGICQPTGL